MAFFASIFQKSWETYPGISYHLNSGNYVDVTRSLDNGLADFGIVIEKTTKASTTTYSSHTGTLGVSSCTETAP